MRESYCQDALDGLLAGVRTRRGWDFSGMNELRQPAPWDYHDVVLRYLRSSDDVLDVGTGAGERLRDLAPSFARGLGIDADPEMVRLAREDPAAGNLSFLVCGERLESAPGDFDVILNRHAPFNLSAIAARLRPGGYFRRLELPWREPDMNATQRRIAEGLLQAGSGTRSQRPYAASASTSSTRSRKATTRSPSAPTGSRAGTSRWTPACPPSSSPPCCSSARSPPKGSPSPSPTSFPHRTWRSPRR